MERFAQMALRLILIAMVIFLASPSPPASAKGKNKANYIIFMVPDGMGLSNVTAARIFKNGPNGDPLYFETLPQIGYQRTHSANSTVTDSAAAASAWACGEKYSNGEISCHDDDGDGSCNDPIVPTILELAKQKGMATGLVATSTITHATPAVWGAHVHSRRCETEIARQYIVETGVDVLLGGGIGGDNVAGGCLKPSPISAGDLIDQAQTTHGYAYVTTRTEMDAAVAAGNERILGLFTPGGKTPETFWVNPADAYPLGEPTLAEMTAAALDVLEDNKKGFFLMVEGSQIDWANHANRMVGSQPDQPGQIGEMLAFDEAVKAVLDWIKAHKKRAQQTLLIIVPDHDCGGFGINGPYGTISEAGDVVEDGWTSDDHTAVDTLIWSQGPGSQYLGGAVDNTYLYGVMEQALGKHKMN